MAQYISVSIYFPRLWALQAHLWSGVISRMTVFLSISSSAVSLQHFIFSSLVSSSSILSYGIWLFSTTKSWCIYEGFRFGQEWLWVLEIKRLQVKLKHVIPIYLRKYFCKMYLEYCSARKPLATYSHGILTLDTASVLEFFLYSASSQPRYRWSSCFNSF